MKYILLLLLFPTVLFAQTIELDLPSCHYLQYHLALKQGTKLDTVAVGRFDERGKATFALPEKYLSFCGVGHLSVRGTNKNWNIIINKENKIAIQEVPDSLDDEIVFNKSVENKSLIDFMAKHKRIVTDYNVAIASPESQSMIFALPEARVTALRKEYKDYLQELKASPLYAARMMELMICLMGTGNELGQGDEEVKQWQRVFISDDLNFDNLYTSVFWQVTFDLWYELSQSSDSLLVSDSKKMLDKTTDIVLRREITQTIIRLFSRYGKDNLLMELGTEYLTMPLNGQIAPYIKVGDESFLPKSSLILFYETGCGNCHYELEALKKKYELLSNDHNNIRIISIAADTNREINIDTSAKLPWADKLCDFKGFDGDNFKNYGIVGTPTYILIDKEGIVRGRYARLSEFLKE